MFAASFFHPNLIEKESSLIAALNFDRSAGLNHMYRTSCNQPSTFWDVKIFRVQHSVTGKCEQDPGCVDQCLLRSQAMHGREDDMGSIGKP